MIDYVRSPQIICQLRKIWFIGNSLQYGKITLIFCTFSFFFRLLSWKNKTYGRIIMGSKCAECAEHLVFRMRTVYSILLRINLLPIVFDFFQY